MNDLGRKLRSSRKDFQGVHQTPNEKQPCTYRSTPGIPVRGCVRPDRCHSRRNCRICCPWASTAPAGPAKIGIINIQQAIALTNEGKRDIEALEKKFDPKRQELQSLNKEVEDLKKQLDSQGSKLNEEARANLVKSIETKQKSLQRQAEDAQNEYQGQQQEMVNRVGTKLMEALDKYAKANGLSLVIDVSGPQNPVLWAQPNVDVTQQVAAAFNAASPITAPAARPASATTTPKPAAPSAPTPK